MRRLVIYAMRWILRFRIGRWITTILFLGVGLLLLIALPGSGPDTFGSILVSMIVFLAIGVTLLVITIRLDLKLRKKKRTAQESMKRAKQLEAEGRLLAIPPLPQTQPRGVSSDDLLSVERYALRLADVPWGERPKIASLQEAYPIFSQTVARVRGVTGDWRALSEPIAIFAGLPKPLCYVGAAEVMLPLSYIQGDTWGPAGLRQGLRFVARAQYDEPEQPDALLIRVKLLSGCADGNWQRLAAETLALAKRIAPQHPRLPEAEATLLIRQGKPEEALACIETCLAYPPSEEEAHMALSRKARLLDRMKRPDESLVVYDLVNQRYPQDPWAWHNKSLVLMNQGRYAEALACNERALSIMDFNVARTTGARIRARMAEAQNASS